jgi:type IV pilus assembly protein PilW
VVVIAVVATMFASNSRTYKISGTIGNLQEAGRFALEALQRDARMVGFRGCNSSNVLNTAPLNNQIATPGDYSNDLTTALAGFEAIGASWNPALPAQISDPGAPVPGSSPSSGSDILLARVAIGAPVAVTAAMANVTADIPVTSTADITTDSRVVVADCATATAFRVTGIGGGSLQHAAGANSTSSVLRAFGPDALAMRYETHAYFVAPSMRDPADERSLWVRTDDQAPVELVESVQTLQVLYGIDTDGDFVPNLYRAANNVPAGNWPNVTALHISLLLRGGINAENDEPTPYIFNGMTTTPTDRRLRRVYNATIQLRNRVP